MIEKMPFLAWLLIALGALSPAMAQTVRANCETAESSPAMIATPAQPFADWLAAFRAQAAADGISETTLNATLTGLRPDDGVLKADRHQPEFVQPFWDCLNDRLTDKRIETGKAMLARNARLLAAAQRAYGVPGRYLVAFWGLETNYGTHMGDIAIIPALATLAYDGRRTDFFRTQLLDALRIVDSGDVPAGDMLGSWAGAFGQTQHVLLAAAIHAHRR